MEELGYLPRQDKSWSDIIDTYLFNSTYLGPEASDECRRIEKNSQQMWLRRKLLELAVERLKNEGLMPGANRAYEIIDEAYDIAESLIGAYFWEIPRSAEGQARLKPSETRKIFRMTYDALPRSLVANIKQNGRLKVARDQFEEGVAAYIKSSYRDSNIDRILIRSLTDMEITAFIEEIVEKPIDGGKSLLVKAQQSVGLNWVKGRFLAFVINASLIAGLVAAELYWPPMPDFLTWAGIPLLVALFLVMTVWSLGYILIKGKELRAPLVRTNNLFNAARSFYVEFHGDGPISVSHLRRRIDELKESGVIWPQVLWVILDDLEDRSISMV